MTDTTFTMRPQKRGRTVYLLLTIFPPILLSLLFNWLTSSNIVFLNLWGRFLIIYAVLGILAYFLIFRKNHVYHVADETITETTFIGKTLEPIYIHQIHTVRRNILQEIILLNEHGKVLLRAESYMTNFDLFIQWLKEHNKD